MVQSISIGGMDTMDEETKTAAKVLTPAAQRALEEAAARKAAHKVHANSPKELGGRGGEDPVRFGDWEVRGIACDF
jgi:hypothetical protein